MKHKGRAVKNREIYDRNENLKYTAKEIGLAVNMYKTLDDTLDIMFYLMQHNVENTFVVMLISAKELELKRLLEKQKRDTDLLYTIDEEEGIYAMICQETKVDGGYRFAERLLSHIAAAKGKDVYCAELEVRTDKYSTKDIIFRTMDTYLKAKHEEKSGEIIFKSVY